MAGHAWVRAKVHVFTCGGRHRQPAALLQPLSVKRHRQPLLPPTRSRLRTTTTTTTTGRAHTGRAQDVA